jgi:predicted regulator of Ras-like GTPase activity (Roadblock/LC7/MglB family)
LQGGKAQVVEDALLAEMRALQEKVTGITGTAVASRDGLIVREDTGGVDPDNLAALAAAWLALAQRMSSEAGQGTLREAMTRSSGGSVTIYAIGGQAVLVIIGDEGLDTTRLHRESQSALDALKTLVAANSTSAKAFLGEREGDGMQCQAHSSTYDRPIDADELQVASEQQLQLSRGLRRVPPLDGPGNQPGELVVELIGEAARA